MDSIVYIDRHYKDPLDGPQPWSRIRWFPDTLAEWEAFFDEDHASKPRFFREVDLAIEWGRARADVVLIRLGSTIDAMYSAGKRHAAERNNAGSEWHFPRWPPASWPRYDGPPEPGWPEYDG